MGYKSLLSMFNFVNLIILCSSSPELKQILRVASSLNPQFLTKLSDNGRQTRYKGFVKDFIEELADVLGYKYEIVISEELHSSVSSRANSSSNYWDGVIGMLTRNEADLAFGDSEITTERAQIVDFSVPVLNSRFKILHKQAIELRAASTSSKWTIFEPFPIAVWIPFFVIAILYFGFLKLHQFRSHTLKFKSLQKLKYSKKFAAVVFSTWLFLLVTSYISNYTAQKVMTASSTEDKEFKSLVDIVSNKDVKIGWLAHGPVDGFFRNTISSIYQKLYVKNAGREWVSSVNEGVNKVLTENGKYAFILDSLTADIERLLDCSLYTLPHEFGPIRSFAVATPIGSSLRERINQAVLSLSEQGIIESLHRRWFLESPSLCSITFTKFNKASMQELSPVFIMAVIGLFVATIIGVWEMQLLKKRRLAPQPKPPRQQAELLPKFNLEIV